jgi:hypothetical protein
LYFGSGRAATYLQINKPFINGLNINVLFSFFPDLPEIQLAGFILGKHLTAVVSFSNNRWLPPV